MVLLDIFDNRTVKENFFYAHVLYIISVQEKNKTEPKEFSGELLQQHLGNLKIKHYNE